MLAPSSKVSLVLGLTLAGAAAHAAPAPPSKGFSVSSYTAGPRTLDVRSFGAKCDGTTIDTAAINAALVALSTGDTLLFPAHATCVIDNGLTVSNLSNVTIEGQGATIQAESTMCAGVHMLKFRDASDLIIQNLTLDANGLAREAYSLSIGGPARDAIAGNGSTLMFYGITGLDLLDVDLLESWHDGLYLGKSTGVLNSDVVVERLYASDAGRNALTVIDCTDCVVADSTLQGGTAGNFDIEPYNTTHVVENVSLVDSVVRGAGAQCIHATNSASGPSQIYNLIFENNDISECHLLGGGGYGAGMVLTDVERVQITNNNFEDIDLAGACGSSDSRSVIDLFLARDVVIENNDFDRLSYDPTKSSVFYFWNDSFGFQMTHQITGNRLHTVPASTGWCWVASGSLFRAAVEKSVSNNTILGAPQAPNPGCY